MARGGYRKFSGRSAFSVQKAYLGEDHLLIVEGVYKESTKRIRYEDIEAILICPTKTGAVMSMLAGLGTVLFTVVALANLQNSSFVLWLIVAVVTGAIFGLGLYHRGSAVFGVQTAVQTVVLAGLGSRRKSLNGPRPCRADSLWRPCERRIRPSARRPGLPAGDRSPQLAQRGHRRSKRTGPLPPTDPTEGSHECASHPGTVFQARQPGGGCQMPGVWALLLP